MPARLTKHLCFSSFILLSLDKDAQLELHRLEVYQPEYCFSKVAIVLWRKYDVGWFDILVGALLVSALAPHKTNVQCRILTRVVAFLYTQGYVYA
jgi:hypothetical protein